MQATLGDLKKDKANDPVTIFLKIDDQKLVLGVLSADKFPQISFDLVFEKEFELSHNGKGGSIYCLGYRAPMEDQGQYPFQFENMCLSCLVWFYDQAVS